MRYQNRLWKVSHRNMINKYKVINLWYTFYLDNERYDYIYNLL